MKVLLGSNSYKSVNKSVVDYLIENSIAELEYLKIEAQEIPLYSVYEEETTGIPKSIQNLFEEIQTYTGEILIATPEYNGNMSAFFKNIIDWLSRIDKRIFEGKKVKVLCVTPGKMAGGSVREILQKALPFLGADEVLTFGIGNYYQIFVDKQIIDEKIKSDLIKFIKD
ncbi:MAG: NADPH-dependent FMN reductase [Mycoplasmatales bacterium]